MNSLITLIIPVYNTDGRCLLRCFESVKKQTYKNLEIIVVDDGSKEECAKACDFFAEQDSRVIVIHKTNGGLSDARNVGIDIAKGEYISFLDSDDYLSTVAMECLFKLCVQHMAEVSIANTVFVSYEQDDELSQCETVVQEIQSNVVAIEASLYQAKYSCSAWCKLYERKLFSEIRFPIGRLNEDLAICHELLVQAKTVAYTNETIYYYRQNPSSIMHVLKEKSFDELEFSINAENFCRLKFPEIQKAAKCRVFNTAIHLMLRMPLDSSLRDMYIKKLWNEIKRTRITVLFDRKSRAREKCAAILSFGGEKILRAVWNSKLAVKHEGIEL